MPVATRAASHEEAARAAEFNEKKWVWVPDEREGYMAGWVVKEEQGDEMGEVVLASGGEHRTLPLYSLSKMNPPKFDRVDDIADLTFLNEASVVHNLRLRYGSNAIYTYSGLFLVAINPYQTLPLYTDAIVDQYRHRRRDEVPPHIFAIAERAWVHMCEERECQSVLITGESGAGKTENTKKVIQYLAAIASESHPTPPTPNMTTSPIIPSSHAHSHSHGSSISHSHSHSSSSSISSLSFPLPPNGLPRMGSFKGSPLRASRNRGLGLLERQILQANPILEAFGNAQTLRNNNSSRFGKFVRISFSPDSSISGAEIDWYLLEKSRVATRNEGERSFHVFYQLLEGGGALRDALLLEGSTEDYEYLNKSRTFVDGVDDRDEWRQLKTALDIVGFTSAEQLDLFRIVAAILHIGNLQLTSSRSVDQTAFTAASQPGTEKICHLLGLPPSEFQKAVLRPRVKAGREWVTQQRTAEQVRDELASLSKTLYERCFGALVERVNRALDRPSAKSTFIGVLDIAGFEIFETNSFEQLCINYTNEKLQQFFNHHMFVLEQEEYSRESIEWDFVNFGLDLQPTIDLIESRDPIGILSCLDEECIMPKATDATFTHKLHALWANSAHAGTEKYAPARFEQGFVVQHYAGKVEYRTDGWLEKNKDPLNDNLTRVLAASSEKFVATLFQEFAEDPTSASAPLVKKRVKKGAFRTVAQRHKEQLASLMAQLQATQPHFVRCIVPNALKKPGKLDVPLVLDQLRCNGVLEGIRIARLGYPNRLPFAEFRQRYEVLTPGVIPRGYMDGRKASARMLDALELDASAYRIGMSKVFFRAGILAELEEKRDAHLFDVFSRLQAAARMFTARRQMRKVLNRANAVRTIQRNARVYIALREWPWWQLYTKVRPLLAATRNDEELRRKDAELSAVRERAEKEKREKVALEGAKLQIEAAKKKVEDELQSERQLGLDKDQQLARSKARESELEDEVAALQSDLDILEAELARAMDAKKVAEDNFETLNLAHDDAKTRLSALVEAQKEWAHKEKALADDATKKSSEWTALEKRRDDLEKIVEELKRLLAEREEDLARLKYRLETSAAELEKKLTAEIQNHESGRAKAEALERDARQAKDQLAELARTATDYESMIQKKETDITHLTDELLASRREHELSIKRAAELEGQAETIARELEAQKDDVKKGSQARLKLQAELDELRKLMNAKTSEDTKRSEVERSKEQERAELRAQVTQLQAQLSEARRLALEDHTKLKVELDAARRDHANALKAYEDLQTQSKSHVDNLREAELAVIHAEKLKRAADSELQNLRSKHIDADGQLAQAQKAKESLERQLAAAHAKHQDFEDAVLQIEREKASWARQMEAVRKQLVAETTKREQLELGVQARDNEIAKLNDRSGKQEKELAKARSELASLDHEVHQLRSRQDVTVIEHVHVLEEAKRVTDRQLAEAQLELQNLSGYVRSLEKAKQRLVGDAEDLTRQTERERQEIRAKEKAVKLQEEKLAQAQAELDNEKKARTAAEAQARRALSDLTNIQSQLADSSNRLTTLQKSKSHLEVELATLASDSDSKNTVPAMRRDYEARIAQLQAQVDSSGNAEAIAERVRQRFEKHHADLRRLIQSNGSKDTDFHSRLLKELELADQAMDREMAERSALRRQQTGNGDLRVFANISPSKKTPEPNGISRVRKDSTPEPPRTPDRQTNLLRSQLQSLELRMVASDRIRQHLESALREMTADLQSSDGSKASLQAHRQKLAKENARLNELLEDEAEARDAAETSKLDGIKTMWTKFQNTIAEERENYVKLEESRKALLAQQRATQIELEDNRRQVTELSQSKKQLQSQLAELKDRVEEEMLAKNEEANLRRELQAQVQELDISSSASSAVHAELQEAANAYKAKADSYLGRLESAEIEKTKAVRAEQFARRSLNEAEQALGQAVGERKAAEDRLLEAEQQIRDLEAKLEDDTREASDMEVFRQRLAEEMEDERDQHQKDLAEREFLMDQTRKKYQAELAQLSEEIQFQRDGMSRLREENRKLRSDHDNLQLQYDDEVYNGGAWKKDKERLEAKIGDLNERYEAAMTAQTEQQTQIVAQLSQIRELRAVLDEAEADRVALQRARRNLETRLEAIEQDHLDSTKFSSDRAYQELRMEKQDLKSALDEQADKMALAAEKQKKAEAYATECQTELSKMREENAELDKMNATLEKQIKELNVHIVDLETKSYVRAGQPSANPSRRLEARIEELTSKLKEESAAKSETIKASRTADKSVRDVRFQLVESERVRARLEEEVRTYEGKVVSMRQSMDELQTSESNLQLAKRRAEREMAEHKQRAASLERELERLRARLERPTSILLDRSERGTPMSSPRKTVDSPRRLDS